MTKGDWFRVASRPGQVYQFMYLSASGDVTSYGGDRRPQARRQFESFTADTVFIPTKAPFTRKADREDT